MTAAGPGLAVVDVKLTGPNIAVSQSFRVARPARHLRARAPHRAAARGGREPHRVERPPRRHPARHRRGVGLGVAARRARRAGAAAGARPLPLWLLRADRQPGAAAALRQQARGDGGAGARHPGSTNGCATRSSACSPARTSNGSFGLWCGRRRRHVARRLRHRLPDPRARAQFRGAAARLRPRARPAAQLRRQHDRGRNRTAPISPMRPMCSPATAGR